MVLSAGEGSSSRGRLLFDEADSSVWSLEVRIGEDTVGWVVFAVESVCPGAPLLLGGI